MWSGTFPAAKWSQRLHPKCVCSAPLKTWPKLKRTLYITPIRMARTYRPRGYGEVQWKQQS